MRLRHRPACPGHARCTARCPSSLPAPTASSAACRRCSKCAKQYRIYAARQIDVPDCEAPGLLVMVHELPDGLGTQITALNFGADPVDEIVRLAGVAGGQAIEMLGGANEGTVDTGGGLHVRLDGYQGKSLLVNE